MVVGGGRGGGSGYFSLQSIGKQDSMSDQPLLCKPALQQEVTGSLNIDYSLMASVHQNPATGHFMSNGDSMSFGDR